MKKNIEICVSTYNRPQFIECWLKYNIRPLDKLGIAIAIYDSSTNSHTEDLVKNIALKSGINIKYVHFEPEIRVDEKVLKSILESEYMYVWPMGDSRIFDLNDIKDKILPIIDDNFDFCCVYDLGDAYDGEIFTDANAFFNKCFWHATLLGGIVFRKKIFEPLQNSTYLSLCNRVFNRNDGFSYLGIFFNLIAKYKINAIFKRVRIINVNKNKTPGWIHRYLTVWCDNLIYLLDNIDKSYDDSKEKVLKETWRILKLDGVEWLYKSRIAGGLTSVLYEYYDKNGFLDRVSDHKDRIRKFAYGRVYLLKNYYYLTVFIRMVLACSRRLKKCCLNIIK